MVRRVAISGEDELQKLRSSIVELSTEGASQLKRHVYENSLPFMQIAKEMAG